MEGGTVGAWVVMVWVVVTVAVDWDIVIVVTDVEFPTALFGTSPLLIVSLA